MPTPRKNFICYECGKKASATTPNFYKQRKKLGYNRCSDCGSKSSANSIRVKHNNIKTNDDVVEVKCNNCGIVRKIKYRQAKKNKPCNRCSILKNHHDGAYKNSYEKRKANKEFRAAIKKGMSKLSKDLLIENAKLGSKYWDNPPYKKVILEKRQSNKYKNSIREVWEKPGYRDKMAEIARERWKNLDYRGKVLKHLESIRKNQPKVSSIQEQLYSLLDDLDIEYYREYNDKEDDSRCKIGPYSFDCVIPLKDKRLLIECQGDYWHSLNESISKDKAKATYIRKYFSDCEIKYLWEHEFKCKDKIQELIKYWIGKTEIELIDFDFDELKINRTKAKDYKLLLSKYHYLPNAGRGGIAYGAYLNKELIAVCIFSPLGRQNIPFDKKSTRELSRFCIHPRYQKRNFASWFISRCIKQLSPKYKTIISYSDTTFNHDGTIYKACNFKLDKEVKPDYWYMSEDGWIMHKKTLYNHATKMGMKEKDYAKLNGYNKIYGKKKLRFVFNLQPTIQQTSQEEV